MEKKTKFIIKKIIIGLALYLLVDYINLPSVIGFMPTNINIDMFGILLDTAVVSILYVISFYYIDNKQNIKDANAKDAVNSLLKKTYQECLDNLNLLDNKTIIAEYIIPKVDGNRPALENKVINNLQVHIEHIMPVEATQWQVEDEVHETYLWRLGNLALLSGKINSSISNKPFEQKKTRYFESKIEPNKEIVGYVEWNENSIQDRQKRLLVYALKIWK